MEHIDLRRGVTTAVCIWPEGDKERAILKEQDSGIFFLAHRKGQPKRTRQQ